MTRRSLRVLPDSPRRAALYVRVSSIAGRQETEFHTVELQLGALRRLVASNGLRETVVIQDIDVSGRTFSREGLSRLSRLVEAGEVDVVAVYDLSRLGRNAAEGLSYIRWLHEHDVAIVSTAENIEDTPEGRFIVGQFLGLAQMYSDQMSRRWSQVLEYRAQAGKHHGGAPTGYRRVEITELPIGKSGRHPTRLEVDPIMGPQMTQAFHDYAAGVAIAEICRRIKLRTGYQLHLSALRRIFHNPVYLGKTVLWGLGKRWPKITDQPALIADGEHPALVDEDTYEKVQARLLRDAFTPERRHLALGWSMVGLAKCGECGRNLQYHRSVVGGKLGMVERLRCGKQANRPDCIGPGTPNLGRVEQAVLEAIGRWMGGMQADVAAVARQQVRAVSLETQRQAVDRELEQVQRELAKLVEGWLAGRVPDSAYESNRDRLLDVEASLKLRQGELGNEPAPPSVPEMLGLGERILRLWPKANPAERRLLLATIVETVTVRRPAYYHEPEIDRTTVNFRWQ